MPVTFSSKRLTNFVENTINNIFPKSVDFESISFREISSIKFATKKITINDNFEINTSSYRQGKLLYAFMLNNIDVTEKERAKNIETFIQDSLDTKKVMELWMQFRKRSIYLRASCNITWLHMFLISPVAILTKGLFASFVPLLIVYIFLHFITIILFYFTYRKIYQDFSREEMFINLIKMLLFPPAVLRSIDLLSVDLFDIYHPLAVIYILDLKDQFQFFAPKLILDLLYPLAVDIQSEKIRMVNSWYKKQQLHMFETFLTKRKIDLQKLIMPCDSTEDYDSYCPRCLMKYNLKSGKCSECIDIDLVHKN